MGGQVQSIFQGKRNISIWKGSVSVFNNGCSVGLRSEVVLLLVIVNSKLGLLKRRAFLCLSSLERERELRKGGREGHLEKMLHLV
jgi:hypothetical protein